MIWRAGLDGSCDYFNETWLAFTGRTLAQEIGDGWADGVHANDLARCLAHYREHFHRQEPFEMEYRLRRHDGVHRWILDRGVPFTDDAGAFAGFIGSCIDVDDRRKAEDMRQQGNREQLTMARNFEKWILAIVSHDLRNPLNTIGFAARRLQDTIEPTRGVRKDVEIIARAAQRIHHIVGDLLDLSRERDGAGITIDPQPADLRALCQEIIDELETIAGGRQIAFECDGDGAGTWDGDRVLQAISNIISNAVQHGAPGSPVRVRLTGDRERVAVEVHNLGIIPAEILPRIFEPFGSVRPHAGRGDGLGLGLFIARAIARAHGGDLEIQSADGRTEVRLMLPRHVASTAVST